MADILAYDDFRTGLTFAEVFTMIWSNSDDARNWPKGSAVPKYRKDQPRKKTAGRRHTVLGKWRQIKLEMYEQYLYAHGEGSADQDSLVESADDGTGEYPF